MFDQLMERMLDYARENAGCAKSVRVAAVVADDLEVLATNSPPPGYKCGLNAACRAACRRVSVHAETRALVRALPRLNGREFDVLLLTVTGEGPVASGLPSCVSCHQLAVESGCIGFWLYQDRGGASPEWVRWDVSQAYESSLYLANLPIVDNIFFEGV